MKPMATNLRERIEVQGIVQGVGFRPFVYSLAQRLRLTGFVRNHSSGVTIEIEGPREQLTQFAESLQQDSPPLAQIDVIAVTAVAPAGSSDFQIIESKSMDVARTPISPDVATCDACLAELADPQNRRYRYPFINCTNCGPRYTIVRDIPYDRPLTTMRSFPMCDACAEEYRDPANRRYHAQPNACPVCGPTVWFVHGERTKDASAFERVTALSAELAIAAFHRSIEADEIVATKGIGGFHLACAATSSAAIRKLRERKGRVDKPLAIMAAEVAVARELAYIDAEEEQLLCSRQRPIVLLRRRADSGLSELVAPGNHYVGIMLPYSPLHALLVERTPLVMTSGNVSEEPIVRTNHQAFTRLNSLADAFLLHNREIHVVCDDSVVRVLRGHELPIRRSRGYAPMPVRLNRTVPTVLAVGGELKATFCFTKDLYAFMSPHIGDMGNLETLDAFERAVAHFRKLFRIEPEVVACDMHPGYLSSQWAREHARANNLQLIEVQHHHAHITAILAEHDLCDSGPVLGISFDGTGYGPDGAIWGGEVLIATCGHYQRWAHLKYFPLPGGDASIKHPYRTALAQLWAEGLPWDDRLPCVAHCPETQRRTLRQQLERNLNCVPTSSMGRLFDAVAALIGVRQSVSYEAQAAMEMEALADHVSRATPYPVSILASAPHVVDTGAMLSAICSDVIDGTPPGVVSSRFHRTIVQLIAELCNRARTEEGIDRVALSGGVFQNVLLLQHTVETLEEAGFEVLVHRVVPPNDGGLALGQAIAAAMRDE